MDEAAENARKGNLQYFSEGQPSEDLQKLAAKTDEDGRSLLHSSASGGNEVLLQMFLQASPPEFVDAADDEGWTPLQSAVSAGHTAIVLSLLQAGADVNKANSGGRSPLHYAASKGHAALIQELVKHGASVNVQDRTGSTPLHRAASVGKLEAVKCLVEQAKARIDVQDGEGSTPLFVALICEQVSIAVYLASKGASLEVATKAGQTPLDVAGTSQKTLIAAAAGTLEG